MNLGLRWEGDPPIWAGQNKAGGFDPTSSTGLRQQTSSSAIYNGDYANWAPRLGLAYDVTGKGTTVVRASGGISYYTTPYFLELINSAFIQEVPTGFTLFNANGSIRPSTGTINVGTVNYTNKQLLPNLGPNIPLFPPGTPSAAMESLRRPPGLILRLARWRSSPPISAWAASTIGCLLFSTRSPITLR